MILPLLFLLFIGGPILEIWVLVRVGEVIGPLDTIALLFFSAFFGAWLARREGRKTLINVQESLARGDLPTNSMIEGLLVFIGGLLMIVPGLVSDGLGLILIFPPTRKLMRRIVKRVMLRGVVVHTNFRPPPTAWTEDGERMRDVTPTPEKSGRLGSSTH